MSLLGAFEEGPAASDAVSAGAGLVAQSSGLGRQSWERICGPGRGPSAWSSRLQGGVAAGGTRELFRPRSSRREAAGIFEQRSVSCNAGFKKNCSGC